MKQFLCMLIAVAILAPLQSFAGPLKVFVQKEYSAGTTSALALAENQSRKYLLIQNKGSQDVYLKFVGASSSTEGVKIIAGGNYEPILVPINAIYLKSASGTQTVTIIEGVQQ